MTFASGLSVRVLGLSPRALDGLARAGIATVGDLERRCLACLLDVRGVGDLTAAEVAAAAESVGAHLAPYPGCPTCCTTSAELATA